MYFWWDCCVENFWHWPCFMIHENSNSLFDCLNLEYQFTWNVTFSHLHFQIFKFLNSGLNLGIYNFTWETTFRYFQILSNKTDENSCKQTSPYTNLSLACTHTDFSLSSWNGHLSHPHEHTILSEGACLFWRIPNKNLWNWEFMDNDVRAVPPLAILNSMFLARILNFQPLEKLPFPLEFSNFNTQSISRLSSQEKDSWTPPMWQVLKNLQILHTWFFEFFERNGPRKRGCPSCVSAIEHEWHTFSWAWISDWDRQFDFIWLGNLAHEPETKPLDQLIYKIYSLVFNMWRWSGPMGLGLNH